METSNGHLKPIQTSTQTNGVEKAATPPPEVEGEEVPLSPMARVFHQPDFNVFIISELGSKTPVDVQLVLEKLPGTPLLKHPRFTSLMVHDPVSGDMKWVPTKLNLSNHVIVPTIDPSAIPSPEKFIEDYVASLTTTSTDFSKPLWEVHILNLPTSKAAAVGIFKTHHSLGDGISLVSLLLAGTRQILDPTALPTIPTARPKPSSERLGFWMMLWLGLRLIWNTLVDVAMFLATSMFLKDTETALTGVPDPEKARWRFLHRTLDLDDLKLVKNSLEGTTINDVLVGITLAALSRYLNRKFGEEREAKGLTVRQNNLPNNVRFTATLMINTRPSPGVHALAEMMERDGSKAKWGNHAGYVLLPFPVKLRDDPLDYVRVSKAVIDRKKHSLEAFATCFIAKIMFMLFGVKTACFMFRRAPANTTMIFSNMVGPVEEIGFCGLTMAHMASGCFGQPSALMISWQSYVNKMTFILSVDENTISDSHGICDDMEESLKLIKDAALARD